MITIQINCITFIWVPQPKIIKKGIVDYRYCSYTHLLPYVKDDLNLNQCIICRSSPLVDFQQSSTHELNLRGQGKISWNDPFTKSQENSASSSAQVLMLAWWNDPFTKSYWWLGHVWEGPKTHWAYRHIANNKRQHAVLDRSIEQGAVDIIVVISILFWPEWPKNLISHNLLKRNTVQNFFA